MEGTNKQNLDLAALREAGDIIICSSTDLEQRMSTGRYRLVGTFRQTRVTCVDDSPANNGHTEMHGYARTHRYGEDSPKENQPYVKEPKQPPECVFQGFVVEEQFFVLAEREDDIRVRLKEQLKSCQKAQHDTSALLQKERKEFKEGLKTLEQHRIMREQSESQLEAIRRRYSNLHKTKDAIERDIGALRESFGTRAVAEVLDPLHKAAEEDEG